MTDIVDWLRREVPHCENQSDYSESDLLILSAADEIEWLREALRYYANKTQEEWVNVTGADDGVIARTALGEKSDD